jgi:hypothetical protein
MKIIKELSIEKPIEDVWEILGNQFGEIDKWASLIHKSEVSGEPSLPGITYSIRSTETAQGPTKQEMLEFDPASYSLKYKAIAGTPFFIKDISAKWSLTKTNNDSTQLILDFNFVTAGLIGMILTPVAKLKLAKLGDELLDDFKYYVENGQPHPRKLAAAKS